MKTKIIGFFITMSLMLATPVFAAEKQAKVSVKGMVCSFCAQGITKKLKAQPEVEDVKVSLESKQVLVSFKDDKELSDEVLTQILTDAGYTVENIER